MIVRSTLREQFGSTFKVADDKLQHTAFLTQGTNWFIGGIIIIFIKYDLSPTAQQIEIGTASHNHGFTLSLVNHALTHICVLNSLVFIEVIDKEVTEIPDDSVTVIATGPLTSDALADRISELCGKSLHFFDAAAPIVTAESIDMECAFTASRYDKGGDDAYINCPMNKDEYESFREALVSAERAPRHDVDVQNPKVYEGCMPIEILAQRGLDTMRFGPMKPVGLRDPRTGHRPWAVLQLRSENEGKTMYNLVGFQTNLKFPEQRRVFGMIPALKNAEFVRYGVMHRNTFLDSPRLLDSDFSMRKRPELFFAGQMTGVEGYMESASSGMMAGINAVRRLQGKPTVTLPPQTMTGALSGHISDITVKDFQPMGANLGILPPLDENIRDKKMRAEKYALRSLEMLEPLLEKIKTGEC